MKLYLQTQAAGQIWPMGCSLPISVPALRINKYIYSMGKITMNCRSIHNTIPHNCHPSAGMFFGNSHPKDLDLLQITKLINSALDSKGFLLVVSFALVSEFDILKGTLAM